MDDVLDLFAPVWNSHFSHHDDCPWKREGFHTDQPCACRAATLAQKLHASTAVLGRLEMELFDAISPIIDTEDFETHFDYYDDSLELYCDSLIDNLNIAPMQSIAAQIKNKTGFSRIWLHCHRRPVLETYNACSCQCF